VPLFPLANFPRLTGTVAELLVVLAAIFMLLILTGRVLSGFRDDGGFIAAKAAIMAPLGASFVVCVDLHCGAGCQYDVANGSIDLTPGSRS
jgi:hypothetical protein